MEKPPYVDPDQLLIQFPEQKQFKAMIRIGDEKFGLDVPAYNHREARQQLAGFYPEARAAVVRIK